MNDPEDGLVVMTSDDLNGVKLGTWYHAEHQAGQTVITEMHSCAVPVVDLNERGETSWDCPGCNLTWLRIKDSTTSGLTLVGCWRADRLQALTRPVNLPEAGPAEADPHTERRAKDMTFPIQQGSLNLYAPAPESPGWSVSDHQMWLAGVYDTRETAVAASELPDQVLEKDLARIYRVDGENRLVTMVDVLRAGDAIRYTIDFEPHRCSTAGCPGHTNSEAICPRDQFSTPRTATDWAARRAARTAIVAADALATIEEAADRG